MFLLSFLLDCSFSTIDQKKLHLFLFIRLCVLLLFNSIPANDSYSLSAINWQYSLVVVGRHLLLSLQRKPENSNSYDLKRHYAEQKEQKQYQKTFTSSLLPLFVLVNTNLWNNWLTEHSKCWKLNCATLRQKDQQQHQQKDIRKIKTAIISFINK